MFKIGRRGRNNVWSNGKGKLFTVSSWEKQRVLMIEIDGNGWNEGNSSVKQKAFCVQLKKRLCELVPSNTQLIRQGVLHYVDSIMKRQKVWHKLWVRVQFWLKVNLENAITRLGPTCTGCCVRNITYNAVASGTYTHHNQSRKKANIKSFGISIFKEIRL